MMPDVQRERELMGTPAGRIRLAIESTEQAAKRAEADAREFEADAARRRQVAKALRDEARTFREALAVLEASGFREPAPLSITTDGDDVGSGP